MTVLDYGFNRIIYIVYNEIVRTEKRKEYRMKKVWSYKPRTKIDIDRQFSQLDIPVVEVDELSLLDTEDLDNQVKIHNLQLENYKAESEAILGYKKLEVDDKRSKRDLLGTGLKAAGYTAMGVLFMYAELSGHIPGRSKAMNFIDKIMKV